MRVFGIRMTVSNATAFPGTKGPQGTHRFQSGWPARMPASRQTTSPAPVAVRLEGVHDPRRRGDHPNRSTIADMLGRSKGSMEMACSCHRRTRLRSVNWGRNTCSARLSARQVDRRRQADSVGDKATFRNEQLAPNDEIVRHQVHVPGDGAEQDGRGITAQTDLHGVGAGAARAPLGRPCRLASTEPDATGSGPTACDSCSETGPTHAHTTIACAPTCCLGASIKLRHWGR